MNGEMDLTKLLKNMRPERNPGEYVFCVVDSFEQVTSLEPICMFREKEGFTVILSKAQADAMSLAYSLVCAWITLTVHSSLEAVGLTYAVSKALAEEDISCNVVAAYYHDHLFVSMEDKEQAMKVLLALTVK